MSGEGGLGANLSGMSMMGSSSRTRSQQQRDDPPNQRHSNLIYDSEVFLTKLREFKPQSLGCLEARRKSSSTLIFPNPRQACMGPPKCPRYPHNVKPTPGYWIECHGPGVTSTTKGSAHQANESNQNSMMRSAGGGGGDDQNTQSCSINLLQGGRGASPSKPDELKLVVDCPSRSSGLSISSSHIPTTPTAERILTRHDKDIMSNQDELDELRRNEFYHHSSRNEATNQGQSNTSSSSHQRTPSMKRQESLGMSRTQTNTSSSPDMLDAALGKQQQQPNQGSTQEEGEQNLKHQHEKQQQQQVTTSSVETSHQQQQRKSANSMRKRLNKRTMTRDDIDLHKPRRGTPNITITEPSFNQSTTTYPEKWSRGQDRSASRQSSQSGGGSGGGYEFRRLESVDSQQSSSTVYTTQEQPIRFQLSSQLSNEAQTSTVLDESSSTSAATAALKQQGSFDRCTSGEHGLLRRQRSSSDNDDELQQQTISGAADVASALDFKPYRQQHRPSVIREDSDPEAGDIATTTGQQQPQQQQQQQQPPQLQQQEQKDLYYGLSTTSFHKKPYQQQTYPSHGAAVAAGGGEESAVDQNTEQFRDSSLELISFEEENYEKHYYGREHWNYFTNDELLGPVMLSLKQEVNNQRDHFHVLLRTVSYTLHGTIPASTICADRYDREAIVRELSEIAKLKPPLMLGQLPSTPDELLKLDHIFIKTELKVGVIYIKAGQAESEESILGNKEESPLFTEFLDLLGDRITLKGFDRYKGGLDTVHNLTGTESIYIMWRNIEIMFHVSTMLPHEENDPQKLQKKRHIGNDIVCVAFIESDDTLFWPGCIKSYFLHTFITVRTSPKPLAEGEKRKYSVSCVCRNEVQYAFKPYLVEQDEFYKSDYFREWLLVKIVNGERASYSAPKFARMQDRTRSQLLEDIITNLANHLVTGQIPKPYRRGSWRPLGHTRASSPLEDSMKDYFEDYEQLAKDFSNAFCGPSRSMLCDVVFRVRDKDGTHKLVHGVRAIMAIRSRTFLEMLYGFVPPGTAPSNLQNQTNLRAIEMKALSGESSSGIGGGGGRELEQTKSLLAKRGSVGADSSRKIEKERRQSMLPNLSKSISQKPNYLTVPSTGSGGGGGSGSGTGGMIKNAFNRLVSGNWSGWSGNIKGYKGEPMHIKVDQNKTKVDLNSLAICKEIAKIDADKLSQREFEIKEFDYDTFQQTIEYIHNGQCKLSYETIPGLICAAEHYDLPDLLHACFHHANTHMKLSAAPKMMNTLYQSSCFYVTAMQLLDSIYEYIDPLGMEFFTRTEYHDLYESVFTTLLIRKTLQVTELKKFQAMDGWARRQVQMKQQEKNQAAAAAAASKLPLQKQQSNEQQQQQAEKEMLRAMAASEIENNKEPPPTTTTGAEAAVSCLGGSSSLLLASGAQTNTTAAAEQQKSTEVLQQQQQHDFMELEYRNLMSRLNKEVNIKLDKITNEDIVKIVLPTKVFSNDKIFDIMADESKNEY